MLLLKLDLNLGEFIYVHYSSHLIGDNYGFVKTVNFDLDCDVIPSSNPSTSSDDQSVFENGYTEVFNKVNMGYFSVDNGLYISEFLIR